jgi:hypothetical protein
MITKEIAETLPNGTILYHKKVKNSRGEPYKCRVNGKCKVWKTRPLDFKLPIKSGLYEYGYITNLNADEWSLDAN